MALVATLATAAAATAAQPDDDGAIVLLGGAARTFLCCFGSTVVNLLRPLDADLYAYLKLKDAATSLVGERAAGGDRELYRPANASKIWGVRGCNLDEQLMTLSFELPLASPATKKNVANHWPPA